MRVICNWLKYLGTSREGGGGGGGGGECIIMIRHRKTFFNQRNHQVFLNFSVPLFILLTLRFEPVRVISQMTICMHSLIILTNFE